MGRSSRRRSPRSSSARTNSATVASAVSTAKAPRRSRIPECRGRLPGGASTVGGEGFTWLSRATGPRARCVDTACRAATIEPPPTGACHRLSRSAGRPRGPRLRQRRSGRARTAGGPRDRSGSGARRRLACVHRDARPPVARLRLLDPGGAGGRAGGRPGGDRPAAAHAGHVRAGVADPPAPRALPRLPGPERRLRRHLRRALRLDGPRHGHLGSGGRVRAVGRQAPAALRPAHRTRPGAPSRRADRAHAGRERLVDHPLRRSR